MSTRHAFGKWAVIGLVAASFLVWAQTMAVDGVAGMLQVGESSALRPIIEEQLGEIPLAPGPGHDGQIYYAIALDLDGDQVGELLDDAGYRYRRILMPVAASLFGLLDGWPLLYGQLLVGILSMSLTAGLVAVMAVRAGRSDLLALVVVLNPGVWLSVQLLTSDAMSLALMVVGLYAFVARRDRASATWFGLAGLAKDVALATPLPLGAVKRRWVIVLIPLVVLAAWMTGLTAMVGGGFDPRGNLALPFWGIVEASPNWSRLDPTEWTYLVFAFLSVVAVSLKKKRRSWLRWPIVAWTGLAVVSSNWVWDFGNNVARAYSPIVVLVALSFTHTVASEPTLPVTAGPRS